MVFGHKFPDSDYVLCRVSRLQELIKPQFPSNNGLQKNLRSIDGSQQTCGVSDKIAKEAENEWLPYLPFVCLCPAIW